MIAHLTRNSVSCLLHSRTLSLSEKSLLTGEYYTVVFGKCGVKRCDHKGLKVWLVADEAAVPALGLSGSPTEVPLSKHAYALASHFV